MRLVITTRRYAPRWLFTISYPTRTLGIIVNYCNYRYVYSQYHHHYYLILLPPQGFGPDGQNPRRHPRGPRVLGRKISQYQKKVSIFQEQGSQGIAEKFARYCRNFDGGQRNTRRSLGTESLNEILNWKGKSCN